MKTDRPSMSPLEAMDRITRVVKQGLDDLGLGDQEVLAPGPRPGAILELAHSVEKASENVKAGMQDVAAAIRELADVLSRT